MFRQNEEVISVLGCCLVFLWTISVPFALSCIFIKVLQYGSNFIRLLKEAQHGS